MKISITFRISPSYGYQVVGYQVCGPQWQVFCSCTSVPAHYNFYCDTSALLEVMQSMLRACVRWLRYDYICSGVVCLACLRDEHQPMTDSIEGSNQVEQYQYHVRSSDYLMTEEYRPFYKRGLFHNLRYQVILYVQVLSNFHSTVFSGSFERNLWLDISW